MCGKIFTPLEKVHTFREGDFLTVFRQFGKIKKLWEKSRQA
jgi:hypothetical protein